MIDKPEDAQPSEEIKKKIDKKPQSGESDGQPSIGVELATFVQRIEALSRTLPLLLGVMYAAVADSSQKVNKYLQENSTSSVGEGDEKLYRLNAESVAGYERRKKRSATARLGRSLLPQTYLIALISQFDAFLGRLIKTLYLVKPELLGGSERSVTLAQLVEFKSLDEAREFLVEKEVESVLRESHAEHFKWLEQKFQLPLRKDLPVWPFFIEVTERRNLFVHTGGAVSSQYLRVCKEHGVDFSAVPLEGVPKVGQELDVSRKYFRFAYHAVFELGYKLAHVLWRKVRPDDRENADSSLLNIAFDVLVEGDYQLARTLMDFATTTIKKHSSEDLRRRLVVNRAQAYIWGGDEKKGLAILDEEDWSASSDAFKICVAALRAQWATAAAGMEHMGSKGDLDKAAYREWPVFHNFRKTEEFRGAFERVFGVPFEEVAKQEGPDLLDLERAGDSSDSESKPDP